MKLIFLNHWGPCSSEIYGFWSYSKTSIHRFYMHDFHTVITQFFSSQKITYANYVKFNGCVILQSVLVPYQWFRIFGTDPQFSQNGCPREKKITKLTWCFWTVKYQYPSCTTNGSVAVIMNWCHASAKSGMMLQQWRWRDDAVKDVCTHTKVMSFTPIGKTVVPCTSFYKTYSKSIYYRHFCSKFFTVWLKDVEHRATFLLCL
jgi:hypothetical protein